MPLTPRTPSTPRRRLLHAAAAASLTLAASACGFAPVAGVQWQGLRVALDGFVPMSPMAAVLRRQLQQAGAVVDVPPAQADVVLVALAVTDDSIAAASTAAGQVRELRLRTTVRWRAQTPQGGLWHDDGLLQSTRDLSYSETLALAKADEQARLFADLHDDLARQMLRRLWVATQRPGGPPAPAGPAR